MVEVKLKGKIHYMVWKTLKETCTEARGAVAVHSMTLASSSLGRPNEIPFK